MQIQTIEEITGLDRATIRYYEKEGLIQPQRLQNGYRDYSQEQLNDLMKIKLLRQLGLSLDIIQHLIEGKDDLQSVLENQIVILNVHKIQIDSAETICKMMIQDNVTYQTIQPHKYISAMNNRRCSENKIIDPPKQKIEYPEAHPFRRFWGRYLDQIFTSAILMLFAFVIFRVRPYSEILNFILSVASIFLTMPINALFLCIFGTTPGKFAVGIFLKTPDGKNLSFFNALQREWNVFRYGSGYNLPIFSWVCLYKSYKIHTKGLELEWDYDSDVTYTQCGTGKLVYSIILSFACFAMVFFSVMYSFYPKYSNENLTIVQFSENLNDYAKHNNMIIRLSEEGEWYTHNAAPVMVFDDNLEIVEQWQFVTDSNNELVKVHAIIKSNNVFIVNSKVNLVVFTAIMSQPNTNIYEATDAIRQLSEMFFINDMQEKQYDFSDVVVRIMNTNPLNEEDVTNDVLIEIVLP